MAKVLLHNAGIVTMDAERHQYMRGAILIEDDRILKIGLNDDMLDLRWLQKQMSSGWICRIAGFCLD